MAIKTALLILFSAANTYGVTIEADEDGNIIAAVEVGKKVWAITAYIIYTCSSLCKGNEFGKMNTAVYICIINKRSLPRPIIFFQCTVARLRRRQCTCGFACGSETCAKGSCREQCITWDKCKLRCRLDKCCSTSCWFDSVSLSVLTFYYIYIEMQRGYDCFCKHKFSIPRSPYLHEWTDERITKYAQQNALPPWFIPSRAPLKHQNLMCDVSVCAHAYFTFLSSSILQSAGRNRKECQSICCQNC